MKDAPEVLLVCMHNAGSQVGTALLHHHGASAVQVRCAGSAGADQIHPATRTARDQPALDLLRKFPDPLTNDVVPAANALNTIGCGDTGPTYPGTRYLDGELNGPAGTPLKQIQPIRDDLDDRARARLADLVAAQSR